MPGTAPKRLCVPRGRKPPRGALWLGAEADGYHAGVSRACGREAALPLRLDDFRRDLKTPGRLLLGDPAWYFRGRDIWCRCPLDQPCPADVLLEHANASTGTSAASEDVEQSCHA